MPLLVVFENQWHIQCWLLCTLVVSNLHIVYFRHMMRSMFGKNNVCGPYIRYQKNKVRILHMDTPCLDTSTVWGEMNRTQQYQHQQLRRMYKNIKCFNAINTAVYKCTNIRMYWHQQETSTIMDMYKTQMITSWLHLLHYRRIIRLHASLQSTTDYRQRWLKWNEIRKWRLSKHTEEEIEVCNISMH